MQAVTHLNFLIHTVCLVKQPQNKTNGRCCKTLVSFIFNGGIVRTPFKVLQCSQRADLYQRSKFQRSSYK